MPLKLISTLMLAASIFSGSAALAADRAETIEALPGRFASQTQCIQGIHVLRYAGTVYNSLPETGRLLINNLDEKNRTFNRMAILDQTWDLLNRSTDLRKYGWNQENLVMYMSILHTMEQQNPENPDYVLDLTSALLNKCYTTFNEFPQDAEREFELIDEVALPQDIGWDSFRLSVNNKPLTLDFDGNPVEK